MTATLDAAKVEAFGMEPAPLVNYVNSSRKIASEYVLRYEGKKRRVYSGTDQPKMYVIVGGVETFLPPEVDAMFMYGKPSYSGLTPVAASVAVLD